MVTLEQVKLLESKVGKALAYIESLSGENATLRDKLEGYRRRIDELEKVVLAFKEDQGRIEEGILSALERLNRFEDAVERGIGEAKSARDTDDEAPAAEAIVGSDGEADPEPIPEESTTGEARDAEPEEDKNGELDIF